MAGVIELPPGLVYSGNMKRPPVVLAIAGYDPSSGAGVTADIKTAAAQGCYAVTCITALTVQSSQGVSHVRAVDPRLVAATLRSLGEDVSFAAVKIGMLGSAGVAEAVYAFLRRVRPPNVVLDPVLRSSSGKPLASGAALAVLRRKLLPLADVITPNVAEAAQLAGQDGPPDGAEWTLAQPALGRMAGRLHRLGARAVIITGGHLAQANDYLSYLRDGSARETILRGSRIATSSTHGTGCAYSTALACHLALGRELPAAARAAKRYLRRALLAAYPVGKGNGPIDHLAP